MGIKQLHRYNSNGVKLTYKTYICVYTNIRIYIWMKQLHDAHTRCFNVKKTRKYLNLKEWVKIY